MNRMLEGLVAWVLNSYVGEYVENLNTERLSIGLLQGEVELDNLPLKKDALKSLGLPIEVKAGFIGRIKLQIPVRRLRSEPWVISMEKVYLVAGPLENSKYDEAAEMKAAQERKAAQLKAFEDKWKLARQIPSSASGSSYWSYWGLDSLTSLATNIVENLQLNIKDVHLRYEDTTTIPGCSFACGIVIKELSAQSTDGTWVPKFVGRYDTDMMHKLVDLKDFNLYWDVDTAPVGGLSMSELADALQREMGQSARTGDFKEHDYILEPVSMQAKMQRNTTPMALRSLSQPRMMFDIELDKIPFALSDVQYHGFVAWMKEFDRHERARRYMKWRPRTKVKEKPEGWWKFAITATLHFIKERNRRKTREYMLQRASDNVLYVEAYTEYLNLGDYYMNSKLKNHMMKMEEELMFDEIKLLRQVAMESVEEGQKLAVVAKEAESPPKDVSPPESLSAPSPSEQPEQSGGLFQRWFPGWGGWGSAATPSQDQGTTTGPGSATDSEGNTAATSPTSPPSSSFVTPTASMPTSPTTETHSPQPEAESGQEIEKEILDVLADSANNTTLKRDTVFAQVNFSLQSGTFRLCSKSVNAGASPTESSSSSQTLLELECSTIKMQMESRPRTNGLKFGISVGGLTLVDKMTPNSILPTLIKPQSKDRVGTQPRQLFGSLLGGVVKTGLYLQPGGAISPTSLSPTQESKLFEFSYEKKPYHSSADYRVEIKTKPLEIVYNPSAIKKLSEFFTVKATSSSSSSSSAEKDELELAAAAKARYEELKKETQAELKQTIDQLLEGEDKIKAKRWDFDLDISAPQFILPENFSDQNTTLVVFDLGQLQFHNTAAKIQEDKPKDEEDDDFVTPSSTPPNEATDDSCRAPTAEPPSMADVFAEELSESALHEKIYDKYTLNLSELQVMVGRAKDSWKTARNKGTSHMHVVDKFSITLQFERRLLYTSDPQWPKTTLSGTLPSLVLHVNEQKIQALRTCLALLSDKSTTPERPSPTAPSSRLRASMGSLEDINKSMYYSVYQNYSKSMISLSEAVDQQTKQAVAESRLVLMQFSINHVSLEVNSRERSVAELQVSGVRASFTKRPYDTSVGFTVHSLLVVDALQTFGEDFELLMASHRNLCLDSQSGSIRGSGPSSPLAPQSPISPHSPPVPDTAPSLASERSSIQTVGAAVSTALQTLVATTTGTLVPQERAPSPIISPFSSLNLPRPPGEANRGLITSDPGVDMEALIRVELDIISPNCPTNGSGDETLHIANIQFNNLDVVANQQTIVELLGFFRRVSPAQKGKMEAARSKQTRDGHHMGREGRSSRATEEEDEEFDITRNYEQEGETSRIEVNADFHRLNLLLMRAEEKDGILVSRKVATATLSKAKIQATMAGDLQMEGSLGGLQLLDLTPEGVQHQKVFSVGFDLDTPMFGDHFNLAPSSAQDNLSSAMDSLFLDATADKAFNFTLFKPSMGQFTPSVSPSPSPLQSSSVYRPSTTDTATSVTLRMASLCYTHSPAFLQDITLCLSEFKGYMGSLGTQIKDVATEVALGWVHRKVDAAGVSMSASTHSLDNLATGRRVRPAHNEVGDDVFSDQYKEEENPSDLKLDIILQTPVIVLPRTPDSPEVLVAHLGRISIQNSMAHTAMAASDSFVVDSQSKDTEAANPDKFHLQIRDMSMYSMNLEKQKSLRRDAMTKGPKITTSMFSTPQPGGYIRTSYGIPILHDTVMEVTIDKVHPDETFINMTDDLNCGLPSGGGKDTGDATKAGLESKILINGKVITPLKLALSKSVYEQILQTLDNITPADDEGTPSPTLPQDRSSSNLTDIHEDLDLSLTHSVSALKLDTVSMSSSASKDRFVTFSTQTEHREGNTSSTSLAHKEKPVPIQADFEMQTFNVQMTGDLGDGEQGLVELQLQNFKVCYMKDDAWSKSLEVSLQSLLIEDLLQEKTSAHRHLMVSYAPPAGRCTSFSPDVDSKAYLSSSCPTSMIEIPEPHMPPSLPSSFHRENVFDLHRAHTTASASRKTSSSEDKHQCPCTPPPSRQRSRRGSTDSQASDALVHIKVLLVDKKCPEFAAKYNNTHRFVEVDFNSLETTINLQTWVVLLDFLGLGARVHNPEEFTEDAKMARSLSKASTPSPTVKEPEEVINTEVDMKVNSLSLVLNKPEYELARATTANFTTHVSLRDGNFTIKGQLGSMSLQDQSSHGQLYRERFTSTGSQALNFSIFKYGLPDPDLTNPYDVQVYMRMSSVRYVHTHRFMQETLAFCQHFVQLQDVLGRMRAASAGHKIQEQAFRSARISMDIEAGAPILLFPHSSRSRDILVMDLGTLTIRNTFLLAGSPSTISAQLASDEVRRKARTESVSSDVTITANQGTATNDISDTTTFFSFSESDRQTGTSSGSYRTPVESPTILLEQNSMTSSVYGSFDSDWRSSELESMHSFGSFELAMDAPSPTCSAESDLTLGSNSTLVGSSAGYDTPQTPSSLNSFFTTLGSPSSLPTCSSLGTPVPGSSVNQWGSNVEAGLASSPGVAGAHSGPARPSSLFETQPTMTAWQMKRYSEDSASVGSPLYRCLLEVMMVELTEMDLFSAEWSSVAEYKKPSNSHSQDLEFASYVVIRKGGALLKEKCRLNLQLERNLEGDISHAVPDLVIQGGLSSVHCSIDLEQYKLLRGMLEHNFGEQLEEFQRPLMSPLQDPKIQTVLSGEVWTGMSISLGLDNVTVELLISHAAEGCQEISLACLEFIRSKLLFDSFSDQSKDIDLVSHEIKAHDTRFRDAPANSRPNVFTDILQASRDCTRPDALQMELHYRSTKTLTRFTVLLNNMRLMGIFDWLLAVQDFLLTNAENPFKKEGGEKEEEEESAHVLATSTYSVAGGIMTKRVPAVDKVFVPLEMKLNVTDTELVVVENAAAWDTNAVILKSTAVLSLRPNSRERSLSCSLQSLEVFSCSLAAEDETALSIIDPMTVTMELATSSNLHKRSSVPSGLADAYGEDDKPPILEMSFSTLNLRLSYNDLKLFMTIINSLPKQALQARNMSQPQNSIKLRYPANQVLKLQNLGFNQSDCENALDAAKGRLEEAASWLLENATPIPTTPPGEQKGLLMSGFEVRAGSICLCLIDDCQDADVPLAELTFHNIHVILRTEPQREGQASFKLTGDYYNRTLSGWEPFLETWGCHLLWNQGLPGENKLDMIIKANDALKLNLTSVLLEQYNKTKVKWTEDYYKADADVAAANHRRRVPFVPFAIRNDTGCKLWFATVTTTPTRITPRDAQGCLDSQYQVSTWREVHPGDTMPFLIDEREKIRHKHTHELKVHQVVVKVEGWKEVTPVSVDRVGTYFRTAQPEINTSSAIYLDKPKARVVFDVSLEGSARKVITVRSALVLRNQLNDPIEIRIEDTTLPLEVKQAQAPVVQLEAHSQLAVPLPYVMSRLWVRPIGWSLQYCNKPIHWHHVMRRGEVNNSMRSCSMPMGDLGTYRFCVSVYRQHFPEDVLPKKCSSTSVQPGTVFVQPGHIISLLPPVRVVNLLPLDLNYYLKGTDIKGTIKPGKTAALTSADLTQALELGLHLENFPRCKELIIPPGTCDYRVKLRIYDNIDRMLELLVNIKAGLGGSLKLSISAPYWLVNKSGLPLVFKQDNTKAEAAGQFEEHEIARSVTPLLFSYADKEAHYLCTMRLGKSSHAPGTVTQWCHKFSLEHGIGVRQLHVIPRDSRPDWVYNIGIEVRQGRGRYHDTNIVTFAPRYQLDNRSQYKLAFAQRHLARGEVLTSTGHLSALPSCKLSFHWPRLDLDQLLCVRIMDDASCAWSGGFRIDNIHSFHINMRTEYTRCRFLRVDIVLQGATFFIVFTDADSMPPPYLIDNYAEIPIMYFQTKVVDDRLRTYIKPRTSVPYAWDEPELLPHITLSVPGGTSATYNMNVISDGDQLYYENFIYVAFSGTFRGLLQQHGASLQHHGASLQRETYDAFVESQELVLDVIHGNKVILKKKEAGKRSQLWRMTSTGMLQHEGSSVPRDPRKPNSSHLTYVLDISDIALQPGRDTTLMLRKPDERRRSTQTWKFTQDGRLCCGNGNYNLCVQAKDGIFGLRDGAEAVLGPSLPAQRSHPQVPVEMAVHRQKSKPGSGVLAVKVVTDGPTRVLQIKDINQQRLVVKSGQGDEWVYVDEACSSQSLETRRDIRQLPAASASTCPENDESDETTSITVAVELPGGIGISLVNHAPEELVFISLSQISIDYMATPTILTLEASVQNVQVDNQLFGTHHSVLLYVTPPSKDTVRPDSIPAIRFGIHKLPKTRWNADIYEHLTISVKKLTVQLEERLLWKLLQFVGFNQALSEVENLDESSFDSQRALAAAAAAKFRRYYFGMLKINTSRLTLSMHTTSELPPDLVAIKRSLGIPFVKFEDAKVELDPFVRVHPFETSAFLLESITLHYTEELKSQAAKILGSVDFLGNPLGLFNDVTEGISGLLKDGNVGGLFKNVTHGVSNSAAKVTGSLSDGIGVLTVDDKHERKRQKIRESHTQTSTDHLMAGFRGLGHGIVGGFTSIITQTYSGIKKEGVEGLITGFSKGVVGTVTKPVAGVLDFASGAASAVRDTSKGSSRVQPPRHRRARCCHGPGGLLPAFSEHHAHAQEFLFSLNNNRYEEMFIAIEQLRFGQEDNLRVLVSSRQVYFLGRSDPTHDNIVLQVSYDKLYHCRSIPYERNFYIELTMKTGIESGVSAPDPKKRPLVRCDSESIAMKVAQQINYAKVLFDEIKQTLPLDDRPNLED